LLVPEAALVGADRPDFVIFPRAPEEAAALHYRFLNRRQDLPLHPAWADWLWERAVRHGEAAPLESRGLHAYRCTPNAQELANDLSAAVRRRELDVPDAPEGSESAEPDGNQQEAAG
jgi:hypothetical protein